MLKRNNINKGFTLIELLIVVALIGVLTTFFVNTSTKNLQRGRDARRKTDLEDIRAHIETFRADCNDYPLTNQITFGGTLNGDSSTANCPASNNYMQAIPQDPTPGKSYLYFSNGTTYELCAALETGTGSVTCGGASSCGSATCNYKTISP